MRLTEEQIQRGILHPEQMARDVAVRYFSESFSDDPTAMLLAIEAVEAYGWENAFRFPHSLAGLAQTEDTLLWVIDQLNRQGRPESDNDLGKCRRLSAIISQADVWLLMKHDQAILGLEGLFSEYRDVIADRLRLTTLDTDSLWGELEQLCTYAKGEDHPGEAMVARGFRLAEAIARDEDAAGRVLDILSRKLRPTENNLKAWMQIAAVRIAGDMRLAPALPLLTTKLMDDDGDVMNEQCERAFVKIGGQAAVQAIGFVFPKAPWHFKLYASSALWNIHCDSVAAKCLELLGSEKDARVRENLAGTVLGNFCSDGIEPARQITLRGSRELRRILVGVATLMEIPFPEIENWKQEERRNDQKIKRRMEEFVAASPAAPAPNIPAINNVVSPAPVQPIVAKEKVGRNDRCPCGSGKKYKKCCGRDK
jgi:hypothetical protein